jgi:hypothetical protein
MRSRTASTIRTDERDSRQKSAFVLFTAETNPEVAEKMANAIAKDVALLSGLTKVVTKLCKHEKARAILGKVFEDPVVAKKFSHAYRAYASAQLFTA